MKEASQFCASCGAQVKLVSETNSETASPQTATLEQLTEDVRRVLVELEKLKGK